MIFQKILQILRPLFSLLVKISCRLDLPIVSSLILILYSKKIKNIKYNLKTNKKIIYFYKSIGYDDLISTFNSSPSNNLIFSLERRFVVEIFVYFVGTEIADFNYLVKRSEESKIKYQKFIKKVFKFLKIYWNLGGFITSTVYPRADHDLAMARGQLNLPFICIHKEGIKPDGQRDIVGWILKNKVGNYRGSKLIVYNEKDKKAFLKYSFANKKQISVCGCPRFDAFLKLKKNKNNNKNIVIFLIERGYGLPFFNLKWIVPKVFKKNFKIKKNDWGKISKQYIKIIKDFIKKNKQYNITFKTKVGFSKQQLKALGDIENKNIKVVKEGSSYNIISKSEIVIAFNSTVMLEALAANRLLISPLDLIKNKNELDFILNVNKNYLPIKHINKLHNKDVKISNLKKYNKKKLNKVFENYVGNSDGKASQRVAKTINSHINNFKY